MRILKYIFDFYIQSSLHVALAVYALIRITFLKLNISYDEPVAHFGFFGTIVGYNFIKYDELARVKKVKLTRTFKAIIGLSILSALFALYFFVELKTKTKLIGLGALLLTILYTLPFFPDKSNMRNWSGVKIYLVAAAWVGVTVLLPVINADLDISIVVVLKCIQRFVFVFVLMLIFEIIDLQFDEKSLETIPQKLGIKKTKLLSYFIIASFLILDFFISHHQQNEFNNYHINKELQGYNLDNFYYVIINSKAQIILFFLLVLFTFYANCNRNKYYTSFWVESVPFFWLILLLVFS